MSKKQLTPADQMALNLAAKRNRCLEIHLGEFVEQMLVVTSQFRAQVARGLSLTYLLTTRTEDVLLAEQVLEQLREPYMIIRKGLLDGDDEQAVSNMREMINHLRMKVCNLKEQLLAGYDYRATSTNPVDNLVSTLKWRAAQAAYEHLNQFLAAWCLIEK